SCVAAALNGLLEIATNDEPPPMLNQNEISARRSALRAALKLSSTMPESIEGALKSGAVHKWPGALKGILLGDLLERGVSDAAKGFVRTAAVEDRDPGVRTDAVRLLAR